MKRSFLIILVFALCLACLPLQAAAGETFQALESRLLPTCTTANGPNPVSLFSARVHESLPEPEDAKVSGPVYRLLFIGGASAEDAADGGQGRGGSQLPDVLRAMLGEKTRVTVGLCCGEEDSLAWNADRAVDGAKAYSLRRISDGGTWEELGACSSEEALGRADWDAVILTASFQELYNDMAFPEKSAASVSLLLDHVSRLAPHARIYVILPWVPTKERKLEAGLEEYKVLASVAPKLLELSGEAGEAKFADLIPLGTAIQNARSTYLALLDYMTDSVLCVETDVHFGLQRNGENLSITLGRYLAALTVAGTLLPPEECSLAGVLPLVRDSESVGVLPLEYSKLTQTAARNAVSLWREKRSLDPTPIPGFEKDPVEAVKPSLEGAKIAVLSCDREEGHMAGALKNTLNARLFEARESWPELTVSRVTTPELYGEYPLYGAEATLRFGYGSVTIRVGGRMEFVGHHTWSRWLCPKEPTCTEPGEEMHYCTVCAETETRPAEPLGHEYTVKVVEPTCTEKGYTAHTCSRCGDHYADGVTPPLVTVEENGEGLVLAGLPEGVTGVAVGYDGIGRLCFIQCIRDRDAAVLWPEEGKPERVRIFFLGEASVPVSLPWE